MNSFKHINSTNNQIDISIAHFLLSQPKEILISIFSFLTFEEIARNARVCRKFNEIASTQFKENIANAKLRFFEVQQSLKLQYQIIARSIEIGTLDELKDNLKNFKNVINIEKKPEGYLSKMTLLHFAINCYDYIDGDKKAKKVRYEKVKALIIAGADLKIQSALRLGWQIPPVQVTPLEYATYLQSEKMIALLNSSEKIKAEAREETEEKKSKCNIS